MKTIREIMDIFGPDEDDNMQDWGAYEAKKKKLEGLIATAFQKCMIDVSDEDDSIYVDMDDRFARVILDDNEISTDKLSVLMKSGLASNYRIGTVSGRGNISIEFILNNSMDDVV